MRGCGQIYNVEDFLRRRKKRTRIHKVTVNLTEEEMAALGDMTNYFEGFTKSEVIGRVLKDIADNSILIR